MNCCKNIVSRGLQNFGKVLVPQLQSSIRLNSSLSQNEEVRIPVPWGHIAGKWWGPTNQRPILTIHGWQDNCGSFNRLIPLLNKDIGFLAIDLPGHGNSSRIPSGLYYHTSVYLTTLQYIVDYFQWPKVSLMGHSLGAVTSYMYTMMYPSSVDFTICIDALKPMISKNNVARIARNLQAFSKYEKLEMSLNEPPSYSIEEIKRRVCEPHRNSIKIQHSDHLIERNIAPSKVYPGQYYFTRDVRLKAGELLNFPQADSLEYTKHVTSPIFVCKAKESSYYEDKENYYEVLDVLRKNNPDCHFHYLDGTHHLHLNTPDILGNLIKDFITKYNTEQRNVGGLKDSVKVSNFG